MGVEPLTPLNVGDLEPFGLERSTPLWYYVLKEAELREDGAGWAGRRPDRRRDAHRPARARSRVVPAEAARLDTDVRHTRLRDHGLPCRSRGSAAATTPRESCLPGRSRSRVRAGGPVRGTEPRAGGRASNGACSAQSDGTLVRELGQAIRRAERQVPWVGPAAPLGTVPPLTGKRLSGERPGRL